MIDFCTPDPKHPGYWICPYNHGDAPHMKVDPQKYPETMRQLAEVWEEGCLAGAQYVRYASKIHNPYLVYTEPEVG